MNQNSNKLCAGCRQHRALFRYRGAVRFDRDHNLCMRCFRSAMSRLGAMVLAIELTRNEDDLYHLLSQSA
jgi:hypothetical protein